MKYKKPLIFAIAIIVIFVAIFSFWNWQREIANEPVRQQVEIR
jgi:hypothetical protein